MDAAVRRCRVAALLLTVVACAGAPTAFAEALSRADYLAHQRQIHADFSADRLECDRLTGHDKRVCLTKAKGRENVALAELDYNVSGTAADAARLATARGESDHAVARAVCAGRPGVEKDRCLKEADAAGAKAAIDARARSGARP